MSANKPRESVLFLFDPLSTPSVPPTRDTHSPDSSSDKENDGPSSQPGQFTAFFNRVYTNPKMVKAPHGRLIDLGEPGETIIERDTAMADALGDAEDEENRVQEANRKPLADIQLEKIPPADVRVPTTIAEEESAEYSSSAERFQAWSEESTVLAHSLSSAAPSGTPLADVINSINLGSLDIHAESKPLAAGPTEATLDTNCPDITVVPPESEPSSPQSSTPTTNFASPFLSPVAPPPVFSPPVRRQHVTTSPSDPRRASVDLHSSFSLQLQSSDMSFDLLNDKISFLSQGQDSFWTGADEEDTMDLAKEEFKMKMIAEKYESIKEEDEIEPLPKERSPQASKKADVCVQDYKLVSSVFSPPLKSSARLEVLSDVSANATVELTAKPPEQSARAATEAALQTSASALPPVPALHIVKKPLKVHDRTSSSSSSSTVCSTLSRPSTGQGATSSACTSRSVSRAGSESFEKEKAEHVEMPTQVPRSRMSRPAIRGIQRPPAGAMVPPAPVRVGGPIRALASSTRSSPSLSSQGITTGISRPSTVASRSGAGAVQHPISGNSVATKVKSAVVSRMHRPSSAAGNDTTRAAANDAMRKPTSALRPPSRIPAPGGAAPGSGLPRPASKLPTLARTTGIKAPSTIVRK